MDFKIVFKGRALKDLKKIPVKFRVRIFKAIEGLKNDPTIGKRLQGEFLGLYSLRVWPYRIIYQVLNKEIVVVVLHVEHRQGVYK